MKDVKITQAGYRLDWIVQTVSLLTLIGLHAAQSQLIREHDIRLGVTFDLVTQHDWVRPPWVVSRSALNLRVGHCGHIAGDVVYGDGDLLRVGAKS